AGTARWRRYVQTPDPQLVGERVLRVRFAVHKVNLSKSRRLGAYSLTPPPQFFSIAVRAVPVQHLNSCAQRNLFPEDANRRPSFDNPPSESVFGLEAYYKDCVPGIARAVREVMDNSSCLGHP